MGDIDVIWRMLSGGHPNRYVDVAITSYMSFNAIIRLMTANGLKIIEFYLSRKPKVENSLCLELTRVLGYSQRTTKSSHVVGPSRIVGNAINLSLIQ